MTRRNRLFAIQNVSIYQAIGVNKTYWRPARGLLFAR
jgi:hypothetical protein